MRAGRDSLNNGRGKRRRRQKKKSQKKAGAWAGGLTGGVAGRHEKKNKQNYPSLAGAGWPDGI